MGKGELWHPAILVNSG